MSAPLPAAAVECGGGCGGGGKSRPLAAAAAAAAGGGVEKIGGGSIIESDRQSNFRTSKGKADLLGAKTKLDERWLQREIKRNWWLRRLSLNVRWVG